MPNPKKPCAVCHYAVQNNHRAIFCDSFLRPTSVAEVSSIVSSMKNSFSEGVDNISILPLKESIDLLAAPLAYICNSSFSEGKFPDKLKIAKILPVYKSDDKSSFTNYRPISILPCFFQSFREALSLQALGIPH